MGGTRTGASLNLSLDEEELWQRTPPPDLFPKLVITQDYFYLQKVFAEKWHGKRGNFPLAFDTDSPCALGQADSPSHAGLLAPEGGK